MRVAILTDFLGGLGGTETLTVRIAIGLRSRGHDVRVFCPRSPANRTWIRLLRSSAVPVLLGAPERLFPDDRGARGRLAKEALLDRWAAHLLAVAFGAWTPDLILANPMGPLLIAWIRSASRPTIPVVGYEFSAADSRCAHWYPAELPAVINQLTIVIAGCEASRQGIVNHHRFTGRTEVVPPLVPPATPQPPPRAPWKLGCIARLCVEKGLDYLLASLPELRQRHPQVSLHIYGEGYDQTRLKDLAQALAVDDIVTLAGRFNPSTGLNRVTAEHSIFIQPSLYESIPTAMLEVAARGRVVVASRVGGIPEFFAAGGQGAMVRPASPSDIADAVSALLDNPTTLAGLGQRNAAVVTTRYGYQQGLDKLEHIFGSLAHCPDGPHSPEHEGSRTPTG
jgi:glycosyltransferase involved in cell wall biosynthesis